MRSLKFDEAKFSILKSTLMEADGLIEAWLSRERKSKETDISEPTDALAFVSQISVIQAIKKHLKSIDPEVNIRPLDRMIDALWDICSGASPILFSTPVEVKQGKPVQRKSNEHLAPIAAAVAILKKLEFSTSSSCKYVAQISSLDEARVKQIHKEFSEHRKTDSAQNLYKVLQQEVLLDEHRGADEFLLKIRDLVYLYQRLV